MKTRNLVKKWKLERRLSKCSTDNTDTILLSSKENRPKNKCLQLSHWVSLKAGQAEIKFGILTENGEETKFFQARSIFEAAKGGCL